MCNNYLGLSDNTEIKAAAQNALENHGFGMSSVRFICGTQDIHKELEQKISEFFELMTPYFIHPVLMLIVVYLKHY
ncbi:MAG: hypothetical protein CM1200mP10_01310 [Candidatus Neomarinimicrobiota bacterium]|nr:MAG: hypothetical protein CM1200mP10_01310 [Candidatus Neomarinimicrobiota bacterium]